MKAMFILSINKISGKSQWSCDFETTDIHEQKRPDTCGMMQDSSDDFDWLIVDGETPSLETGPKKAYHGIYYAYIEASERHSWSKAT